MSVYAPGQARTIGPGESAYLFGVPNTAAALASTGLTRSGGTVTATTSAAHKFVPGQQVDIKGALSAGNFTGVYGFDGSYTILTVPSTTTFTYADPQKPDDTGGSGNAISVAAEQPAAPAAGGAAYIAAPDFGNYPASVRFEGWWTAAPSTFEIDLQSASSDVDGAYVMNTANSATKVTANASDTNVSNMFTVDLSPAPGAFMRPRLISRTNAVGLVVKVTGVA